MKVSQLIALTAISLLAMSNSCKKEEGLPSPCETSLLTDTAQITGLNSCIAEPIPNAGQSLEYVVNSAADYQALFSCTTPPVVDFTTHTLLAGKTRTASCSHVLSQQVALTCTGYTYTVKLEAGVCAAVTNVVYYVLVPKIPSGTKVNFDVQLPKLPQ